MGFYRPAILLSASAIGWSTRSESGRAYPPAFLFVRTISDKTKTDLSSLGLFV